MNRDDENEFDNAFSNLEIEDFIDSIDDQRFSDAEEKFNDLLSSRISDSLEQTKVKVAADIFNNLDADELGYEEDLTDDDLEYVEEEDFDDDEDL